MSIFNSWGTENRKCTEAPITAAQHPARRAASPGLSGAGIGRERKAEDGSFLRDNQ